MSYFKGGQGRQGRQFRELLAYWPGLHRIMTVGLCIMALYTALEVVKNHQLKSSQTAYLKGR